MATRRTQRFIERFGRATLVGVVATLSDLGILTLLVEVAQVSEVVANWPSLFVGVTIQFLGAKYAVFKAADGSWLRHISGFLIAEVGTYLLNGFAFHLLVTLTPISYVAARLIGTFVVFIGFSYPVWHWVFKDGKALAKNPEQSDGVASTEAAHSEEDRARHADSGGTPEAPSEK